MLDKILTSISVMNIAEGTRVGWTYSESDVKGYLHNTNVQDGRMTNGDASLEGLANELFNYVELNLLNDDVVQANDRVLTSVSLVNMARGYRLGWTYSEVEKNNGRIINHNKQESRMFSQRARNLDVGLSLFDYIENNFLSGSNQ